MDKSPDYLNSMEEAEDNTGTQGNSIGMVPPGMDEDNVREASEEAGATGNAGPQQATKAQQLTAGELKRLGSRNPPGRLEGLGFVQDRRRRESSLVTIKANYEILSQQFGEQLEDLEENQALGRWTEEQLRGAFRELRVNERQLAEVGNELTGRHATVGAV